MKERTLFALSINMRSLLCSLCALPFLLTNASFAENLDSDKKENNASDIVITAEKVTCEKNNNKCVAEINVKVVQQSDKQPTTSQTLTTDHLTVVFEDDKTSKNQDTQSSSSSEDSNPLGSSDIKEILAQGKVKVVRGDLIIVSERAKYVSDTDTVEFFDNVKIKDGDKAYIESSYASMNRKTGKYEVKALSKDAHHKKASQKVQIIITQKKSSKN